MTKLSYKRIKKLCFPLDEYAVMEFKPDCYFVREMTETEKYFVKHPNEFLNGIVNSIGLNVLGRKMTNTNDTIESVFMNIAKERENNV